MLPLLDGVLETKKLLLGEQEKRRKAFLGKVRESEGQDLAALLEAYRKARDEDKDTVKKAQEQLREVLTLGQEAKLVGLNILD